MSLIRTFKRTDDQTKASELLGSDAMHVMLYGGSRSGKTFILVYSIIMRALRAPESRHAILRFRFNHVKTSIWRDTLPKVLKVCFPDLRKTIFWNHSDAFIRLHNGSEIYLFGLDDKERVEKILGNEYATIYFNECSQISYEAVGIALTRLAQKTELKLKAYYDCNPPSKRHWTYKLFVQGIDPESGMLKKKDLYAYMLMNPQGNKENLAAGYIENTLSQLSERKRKRFLEGIFLDDVEGALWTYEIIERNRVTKHPELQRVVVSIDPATTGKDTSDETGIIVSGKGVDGKGYVLADYSGTYSPNGWATKAIWAYHHHKADIIVAEANNGGDMIETIIRNIDKTVPYKKVHASRGKVTRAEPIADLYERDLIKHVWPEESERNPFDELEDQMATWNHAEGEKSPDRIDAKVWGLTELMLGKQGWVI